MQLSEHVHIQPSEWDLMPYSQMQFMIDSKLNSNKTAQQEDSTHTQMLANQNAMLQNMKSSMKMPAVKLPSIRF